MSSVDVLSLILCSDGNLIWHTAGKRSAPVPSHRCGQGVNMTDGHRRGFALGSHEGLGVGLGVGGPAINNRRWGQRRLFLLEKWWGRCCTQTRVAHKLHQFGGVRKDNLACNLSSRMVCAKVAKKGLCYSQQKKENNSSNTLRSSSGISASWLCSASLSCPQGSFIVAICVCLAGVFYKLRCLGIAFFL